MPRLIITEKAGLAQSSRRNLNPRITVLRTVAFPLGYVNTYPKESPTPTGYRRCQREVIRSGSSLQCLIQVPQDILDIFDANAQADKIGGHAG